MVESFSELELFGMVKVSMGSNISLIALYKTRLERLNTTPNNTELIKTWNTQRVSLLVQLFVLAFPYNRSR